jgi:hypothetical protein
MSESSQVVAQLEQNVVLLLNKLKDNHFAIATLREQLEESKTHQVKLNQVNEALKTENDSLSMANALLGSDESKTTTKNKINTLIRQVDDCIIALERME